MNKIMKQMNISFSKINFNDIPMIVNPMNNDVECKHYVCTFADYYFCLSQVDLPINYFFIDLLFISNTIYKI